MIYAIGVDLGATNIKTLAVGVEGAVLLDRSDETDDGPEMRWAANLRDAVTGIETAMGATAEWVGVCSPGLIYPDERAVSWMVDRMESTVDFEWREFLDRDHFVPVLNDGQAALLGEVWQGAAKGARNVVALTLGTGVGGAVLVRGQPSQGSYRPGRASSAISGSTRTDTPIYAICRAAWTTCSAMRPSPRRSGGRFADTTELVRAYQAGDRAAAELWLETIHYLACGIASLINTVDPEIVVIGGGIASAGESLFGPLDAAMARVEWRPNGYPGAHRAGAPRRSRRRPRRRLERHAPRTLYRQAREWARLMFPQAPGGTIRPLGFRAKGAAPLLLRSIRRACRRADEGVFIGSAVLGD